MHREKLEYLEYVIQKRDFMILTAQHCDVDSLLKSPGRYEQNIGITW